VQFYERKEVKDVLAYLKLLANPADDVSFRRAVNTPPRGIGAGTLAALEEIARDRDLPLLEALGWAAEHGGLPSRSEKKLRAFADLFADLLGTAERDSVATTLDAILERTDYETYLEKAYPGQGHERMENVRSLVSAAAEYWEEEDDPSLLGFLDRSALVSDADEVGRGEGVTLMTIHNAKGLEFLHVFLAGLEENLFPHARSIGSDADLEEERRLCYVAMTRARRELSLSWAGVRRVQGQWLPNPPSRFLDEIPSELTEDVTPSLGAMWERPPSWERAGRSEPSGSSAHLAAARAAAPVRGASAPAAESETAGEYRVGRRVRHPKFGQGEIVGVEGSGRALKLTIRFLDHGFKKILPSYTKLQVEA
jgi:DNA helicase-2/ATP-dependent DNA helicase PcrA